MNDDLKSKPDDMLGMVRTEVNCKKCVGTWAIYFQMIHHQMVSATVSILQHSILHPKIDINGQRPVIWQRTRCTIKESNQ